MKKMMLKRILIALLIGTAILTMPVMAWCKIDIDSIPQGAMVYFNNNYYGTTPGLFEVAESSATITEIKLVKDNLEWNSKVSYPYLVYCPPECYQTPTTICQFGPLDPIPRLEPKPVTTPEFPSMFLPVTMIIGFLGAVLLIQRTREH